MTYRELLKLYKQGKLEDSTKKQIGSGNRKAGCNQ